MIHSPQTTRVHASSPRSLPKKGVGLAFALIILAGCGAGPSASSTTAAHSPGDLVAKPGGGFFYADVNNMGNGSQVHISRQAYGRLVEVFGLDSSGLRVHMASDFVMAPSQVSDGQDHMV
jgi:hypothetical protein